ncbi:ABC transporter substrate-binding protein [Desulfopila inferna]|uniref:ABC transporter substrate-binding protein n=1 Tax=Desulfopila inferna TaxID=468528 RepID=UPI0019666CFB|nr:ABC transporter substrate-binding protein [Desulfopila inferna]MBM9603782.1 ABC transporter substrate-binding protein [Desulfopila inferna]
MKKILTFVFLYSLITLSSAAMAAETLISISQFVDHPSLNEVLQGFQDDLAENEIEVRYKVYNSHGNMATTGQIANQIVSDNPDMIVAIATPNAQACARIFEKHARMSGTPMVFTAITDPLAAGLVSNYEHPGKNITGVSNRLPMDKHMEMVLRFVPDLKKLGVMYNSGEVNSVSNVNRIKEAAAVLGFSIVEAPATNTADVYQAAQSLVGKVQAIYIPTDNTVISALESVIKVSERVRLPLFTADTDSVKRGSIAAMGFDYYLHGRQTGALARRIIAGENPGDIAVEFQKELSFHVNPGAAQRMGLTIDEDILNSADFLH